MTLKKFRELTKELHEDTEVLIEYDGPDAFVDLAVESMRNSDEGYCIVLVGKK